MNKTVFGALFAAIALTATPAMANTESFDGPRVGGLVGVSGDDFAFNDAELTYGGVIGYDVAVTESLLLGVEADVTSVDLDTSGLGFDVDNRQISVAVRATYPVSPKFALFGSAGYTNLELSDDVAGVDFSTNFDGYRLGGGAEVKLGQNGYATAEYRFSQYDFDDLGNDDIQSVLVGVGVRF